MSYWTANPTAYLYEAQHHPASHLPASPSRPHHNQHRPQSPGFSRSLLVLDAFLEHVESAAKYPSSRSLLYSLDDLRHLRSELDPSLRRLSCFHCSTATQWQNLTSFAYLVGPSADISAREFVLHFNLLSDCCRTERATCVGESPSSFHEHSRLSLAQSESSQATADSGYSSNSFSPTRLDEGLPGSRFDTQPTEGKDWKAFRNSPPSDVSLSLRIPEAILLNRDENMDSMDPTHCLGSHNSLSDSPDGQRTPRVSSPFEL